MQLPRLSIWLQTVLSCCCCTRSQPLALSLRFGVLGELWCVVRSTLAARRMLNDIAGDSGFYTPVAGKRQLGSTKSRTPHINVRLVAAPLGFSSVSRSSRVDARSSTQLAAAAASQWQLAVAAQRQLGLARSMALLAWLPLVRLAFSICPCWQRLKQRHHCTVL